MYEEYKSKGNRHVKKVMCPDSGQTSIQDMFLGHAFVDFRTSLKRRSSITQSASRSFPIEQLLITTELSATSR